MNRRQFIRTAGLALSAPYVLRFGGAFAQTPRVRRSLASLTANDPFFTQYGEAIRAMHRLPDTDRRSWRGQAMIHADFCPHGTNGFILWHRHYIAYFERLCGSLIGNPNFALPYWDWTANNGRLPAAFVEEGGPLNVATWRDRANHRGVQTTATRSINARRGLLDDAARSGPFRSRQLNAIQQQTEFSLFQAMLENTPHNTAHTICGGSNGHMLDMMSPLDPIFWLHHCNVDRLTAQWQRAGRRVPPPNLAYNRQFVDPQGAVQSVTAAQALDFAAMGYTYDIMAEQVVASRTEQPPAPAPAPAVPPAPPPRAPASEAREAPVQQEPTRGAERPSEGRQRGLRGGSDEYDGVVIDGAGPREPSRRAELQDDFGIDIGQSDDRQPASHDHSAHEEQQAARPTPAGQQISVIGRSDAAQPCSVGQATSIAVATERAFNDIISGSSRRGLRGSRGEAAAPADAGRILARLTVQELQGEVRRCLVNVFVNAPGVTASTPADDPRYVGSFSFFGAHHVEHGGSFLVDVTEAVRGQAERGQISTGALDVQVMPVTADPNGDAQARFVVNRVELISG